jgi:hypothetical protein
MKEKKKKKKWLMQLVCATEAGPAMSQLPHLTSPHLTTLLLLSSLYLSLFG